MKHLFISPHEEMVPLVKEVCSELEFKDWQVECCAIEDSLSRALWYVKQGTEIIVSRGITADILKECLSIPIVQMNTSPYDILPLLPQIGQTPQQVGVVGFPLSVYGITGLNKSLCHKFIEFPLASLEDIPATIKRAKEMEIKIIIGGKKTVKEADANGLKGILFQSGKNSIATAIFHAISIVNEQHREKVQIDRLNLLLDLCNSGVVLTDCFGKIIFSNKLAATMFCIHSLMLVGTDIKKYIPDFEADFHPDPILQKHENKVIQVGNNRLLYNITPVEGEGDSTEMIILLQYVREIESLAALARKQIYQKGLVAKYHFDDILTKSPVMMDTICQARKYAPVDSTILITGETGTGKEMLAQSIHNASRRNSGPFVAINCASIPDTLLESEMFGYENGAFSGARKNGKKGYFELAHGGTLFLDEIGEIPIALQMAFLRVLQERSIIKIGGDAVVPVDIRIICATHQNLMKACQENRFRLDLYHRLNILRLKVPSLNERIEDIPLLSEIFIRQKAAKLGLNTIILTPEVIRQLQEKNWSGNVRELEGMIERLVVLRSGNVIQMADFNQIFKEEVDFTENLVSGFLTPESPAFPTNRLSLKESEKQRILLLYQKYHGKRSKICEELSISKATLWRRLKEYGI